MCPYEFRTQVPSCDLCWSKNRPPSRLVDGSGPARRLPTSGLCSLVSKMRRASSEQQRSKVGFPIRKFSDQSLFAAPRNLSQRTTSFIASQRQGIHQIPFWHLIALIAKARFILRSRRSGERSLARKDQFCFKRIRRFLRSSSNLRLVLEGPNSRANQNPAMTSRPARASLSPHPALDRMRFLFTMSEIESRPTRRGEAALDDDLPSSAPRLNAAHASSKDRTDKSHRTIRIDPRFASRNRRPLPEALVEPDGIEPTTSCLQSTRSPN